MSDDTNTASEANTEVVVSETETGEVAKVVTAPKKRGRPAKTNPDGTPIVKVVKEPKPPRVKKPVELRKARALAGACTESEYDRAQRALHRSPQYHTLSQLVREATLAVVDRLNAEADEREAANPELPGVGEAATEVAA